MKANKTRGGDPSHAPGPARAWIAFLVLCIVGALLSLELERLHVRAYTDPDGSSYCSVGEHLDCDAVATSPWSVWFGIPVAIWGFFAYVTMGGLAAWGLCKREPCWQQALAYVLALVAVAGALGLFAISHFLIGSICLMCVATYVVNFGLAACGFVAARGATGPTLRLLGEHARAVLAVAAVGVLVVTGTAASMPHYWRSPTRTGPGGLMVGVDAAGHPWIGAVGADPSIIEIVEYSDYECPYCSAGHAAVRKLVEKRPDLRLVHRHYPLDDACNPTITKPFHRNACRYARIAWCAQQQGRFWEANDYLYANRASDLEVRDVATAAGLDAAKLAACTESKAAARAIAADLTAGREAEIGGTPTFVIDGKAYPGGIPAEALPATE